MKNWKYTWLALSVAGLMTACDDQSQEITSLDLPREFSPFSLSAQVLNQTDVRLSWARTGAGSYTIRMYHEEADSVSSTLFRVVDDILPDQIPYTVTGVLDYSETYRFDIISVDAENPWRNSKTSSISVLTGDESIMKTPETEAIFADSVILTFSAPIMARDSIFVTPTAGGSTIRYEVTPAEAAAGRVVIHELEEETEYTAKLYHYDTSTGRRKCRGVVRFTTIIDLAGLNLIKTGEDLYNAIVGAADGDVLALDSVEICIPSYDAIEGFAEGPAAVQVPKNVSITLKSARRGKFATIKGNFELLEGSAITLTNLNLDLTGTKGYCVSVKGTKRIPYISLDGCTVVGDPTLTNGLIGNSSAAVCDSLSINNTVISGIVCAGGDFIDARSSGGTFGKVLLTDNTLINCFKSRDFIRMDANAGTDVAPVIQVEHCTFYDCGSGAANYRMFYLRQLDNKITFRYNVMAGFCNKRGFANNSNTDLEPALSGNYYYSCENLVSPGSSADANITFFDEKGIELESTPFRDAAHGDFTIINPDVLASGAGDARWR